MFRALLALGVGLFAASIAIADIGPPKGVKRVVLDHKITTDKEITDYTFYTVLSAGKGAPKVTQVKFGPKTPIVIPGAPRGIFGWQGWVVAVPKDAAKSYASNKEFLKAIQDSKVEGLAKTLNLDSFAVVKDTDKRNTIVREHAFDKIDGKMILLTTKNDDAIPEKKSGAAPEKKGDGKDSPDDEEDPAPTPGVTAYTPRGGVWIAGVAAALAVMLGGFWLVGRGKRRT